MTPVKNSMGGLHWPPYHSAPPPPTGAFTVVKGSGTLADFSTASLLTVLDRVAFMKFGNILFTRYPSEPYPNSQHNPYLTDASMFY